MGHVKRDFKRKSKLRDSSLIIIATEGKVTEVQYFEGLKIRQANPKIHIEILEREVGSSSPAHVIRDLKAFKKEYNLNSDDELWMVIDKDRWPMQTLSSVARECTQQGFYLAVSNPCFELWLLFHLRSLTDYTASKQGKFLSQKKAALVNELRDLLGSFNPTNLNTANFLHRINTAISNAQTADTNPTERWPNGLGSRVYKLAQKII